MKNDNRKIYEKALNLYNNGEIDKAIELCEKGISNSLKDAKILNLKGLLLYIQGKLEEATALWKINKDYNDDSIARAYLEDSKNDLNRYLLCKESESLIENFYIDEALENLLECNKSDFNLIEVNNLMALAYMKKGQYDNSRLCLEKILTVDKKNPIAKERLKEINDLLGINKKGRLLIGALSLIVLLSLSILVIYKLGIIKIDLKGNGITKILSFNKKEENNKKDVDNNKKDVDKLSEKKEDKTLEKDKDNLETEKKDDEVLDEKTEGTSSTDELKTLTKEEIQKNYSDGSYYFKIKEYDQAIKIFEETRKSSQNSYLDDDILFFLASSYERKKDEDKAIETYRDFLSKYEKGSYVEEAFYRIILLYEDRDINISKDYAKKLIELYPSSIYNNAKVQNILVK